MVRSNRVSHMDVEEVVQHLLRSAQWTASRSTGPGGQHRDKASTRAELTLDATTLAGLEPHVAARLSDALGLDGRAIRISVQDERSLSRNQEIAVERLTDLVAQALAPPPPPRRPTRPTRARREARLADKAHRGSTKRLRRPPEDHLA
jgi:ribosome-associated protein